MEKAKFSLQIKRKRDHWLKLQSWITAFVIRNKTETSIINLLFYKLRKFSFFTEYEANFIQNRFFPSGTQILLLSESFHFFERSKRIFLEEENDSFWKRIPF